MIEVERSYQCTLSLARSDNAEVGMGWAELSETVVSTAHPMLGLPATQSHGVRSSDATALGL